MLLNDDIIDIEKPDGICLLTFVANEFSGLFLHSPITKQIALSDLVASPDFSDWLNSNILASSEGIIILQESLFSHTFLRHSPLLSDAKE